MRKLAIAAAVSMSLATLSVNTHALGLGEIEMFSALNQTLDAEIGIVSYSPQELEGLNVRLASEQAFATAGLARPQMLDQIQFDIERRPDGVPVIKISSDGPIIEPFISFLLELESPAGTAVVREYTVLLDPPVFSAQQSEIAVDAPAMAVSDQLGTGVGVSTLVDRDPDLTAGVVVDLQTEIGDSTSDYLIQDARPVPIDAADGAAVDLGGLLADSNASAERMTMQTAQLLDTVEGTEQVSPIASQPMFAAEGEVVDLSAEIQTDTDAVVETADSFDVSLADLDPAELFVDDSSSAGAALFDAQENIVDLASLRNEYAGSASGDVTDAVGQMALVDDSVVDLSSLAQSSGMVEPVTQSSEALFVDVDLSNLVAEPEVTIEEIETRVIPGAAISRGDGNTAVVMAGSDEVLGEAIDLSGVIVGDVNSLSVSSNASGALESDGYRIQSDDTLWSIARTQKAAGVSTQQMLVAILEANPDAFIDGDMNRMRTGAVLQIPAEFAPISNADAVAMVREKAPVTGGTADSDSSAAGAEKMAETSEATTEAASVEQAVERLSIVAVDDSASAGGTAATEQQSVGSDLERNLDEVNKKVLLAQEELSSEALQRDELSERVVELEDSLDKMKKLITLRESELGDLQTELSTAQTDSSQNAMEAAEKTRALELAEAERKKVQADLKRLQESISADATMAQERVAAQADADKNLASAQAEVQSIRLSTEEDAIKLQLAQLQLEKEQYQKSAQDEKLALVREAEAEKARLLAEAKAERERIQASLEAEKARITAAAAAERDRIAAEAQAEKEQLITAANVERDRLAAESEAMRVKLAALEEEKTRLLAQAEADKAEIAQVSKQAAEDQSRLLAEAEAEKLKFEQESARVKDRLAALQAEASANLANTGTDSATEVAQVVSDAQVTPVAVVETDTEAGSDLMQDLSTKGTAAVGGLLAIAPLQRVMGDRTKVLAAGGGVALLGLLGAWATRRRKPVVKDVPLDIDTNEDSGNLARTHFDTRVDTRENTESRSTMGQAAVAASAAAAAGGAAVVKEQVAPAQQASEEAGKSVPVLTDKPKSVSEPAAPVVKSEADPAHEPADAHLLDDTITEADVYLRYGLHGQAEDLLLTAIERAPENEEYHLKLLENYHSQENGEAFKKAAGNYKNRFGGSESWERIAAMGRDIDPGDSLFSRVAGVDVSSGAATGAVAAAAAAAATAASSKAADAADLDRTIDAGAEFNMDDLTATGDLSGADSFGVGDLEDVSLDEVDLAALDDDGTLNLEEIAGNQMSGLDLGSLDLTNPDGDSTLDNLTLDDADLNSLGLNTGNLAGGAESDLDLSASYGADASEMETMLDLAKAYIDMGDSGSAANTLRDIVTNGNAAQQKEASELLKNLT